MFFSLVAIFTITHAAGCSQNKNDDPSNGAADASVGADAADSDGNTNENGDPLIDAAAVTDADDTDGNNIDSGNGDNGFTEDGCLKWAGESELGDAINQYECVEIQEGTYVLSAGVFAKPGHTLRGVNSATTILKAASTWTFGCCDAMVNDTLPSDPETNPFTVSNLTLDGSGVATYNVCCRGFLVEDSVLKNSRCSAIGAAGRGVTANNNLMLNSAQPTNVENRGLINCATGGFGGVDEGAAIYSEAKAVDLGTVIEGNTILNSYGPALDINGAWGGVFRDNIVADNSDWAAVSLYGASNWVIENNQISHPADQPPQPYHPYCAGGPAGGNSAGIFLCQDTDEDNLVTTGNLIINNQSVSFYGILSIGADEIQPYWAPRNNVFSGNDVFGSVVGCADDFEPGQWFSDENVWTDNNCAGSPDTGPIYF